MECSLYAAPLPRDSLGGLPRGNRSQVLRTGHRETPRVKGLAGPESHTVEVEKRTKLSQVLHMHVLASMYIHTKCKTHKQIFKKKNKEKEIRKNEKDFFLNSAFLKIIFFKPLFLPICHLQEKKSQRAEP